MAAHPSVPASNLQELIALAKASPDSLTFGSSGYATASHMAAALFNDKAGTKILTVPYQGGSNQAVSDLLAGRITLMFNVAATLAPHAAQIFKHDLQQAFSERADEVKHLRQQTP